MNLRTKLERLEQQAAVGDHPDTEDARDLKAEIASAMALPEPERGQALVQLHRETLNSPGTLGRPWTSDPDYRRLLARPAEELKRLHATALGVDS